MTDREYSWRVTFAAVVVTFMMFGLGVRLAFLHIWATDKYGECVVNQRSVESTILGPRGRIYDRNKQLLALDRPTMQVFVDPKRIAATGAVQRTAYSLHRLLEMPLSDVFKQLAYTEKEYRVVKRNASLEQAEKVKEAGLYGVHMRERSKRIYPLGGLMSHVVGYGNARGGTIGVEQQVNSFLLSRSGLQISRKDGLGRPIYTERRLEAKPTPGANVELTVDVNLQYAVEQALDEAVEKYSAAGAWAIVQHVKTGEILAMASRPDFDLNEYGEASPLQKLNRSLGYVYEPGSTMKLAIIAAALNEGVVTPDLVLDVEDGYWYYAGRRLKDYHGYDELNVADILKKSSNIGAAKIALRMGDQTTYRYLKEFGFGTLTGIDLPGEEIGLLRAPRSWQKISITRIAMGHEIGVTSLQLLNAVCAIANDGFLMRPYVIKRVADAEGRVFLENEPEVLSRPIRKDTADMMKLLMRRVTEKGGTARRARIDGYTVGGKTGTAQKVIKKRYSDHLNIASFVGVLPAEQPEIGIIVVVDEPQPLHTGGVVAAPVFKSIGEMAIRYLDIKPTKPMPEELLFVER